MLHYLALSVIIAVNLFAGFTFALRREKIYARLATTGDLESDGSFLFPISDFRGRQKYTPAPIRILGPGIVYRCLCSIFWPLSIAWSFLVAGCFAAGGFALGVIGLWRLCRTL